MTRKKNREKNGGEMHGKYGSKEKHECCLSYSRAYDPTTEHVSDSPHSEAHGQSYHLDGGDHHQVSYSNEKLKVIAVASQGFKERKPSLLGGKQHENEQI